MVPAGDGMNAAGRRTHWRSGERETRRLMAGTGVGKSIQSASAVSDAQRRRMKERKKKLRRQRKFSLHRGFGVGRSIQCKRGG
eukprot:1158078-Pelagomonas_calceolata.AAC.1